MWGITLECRKKKLAKATPLFFMRPFAKPRLTLSARLLQRASAPRSLEVSPQGERP